MGLVRRYFERRFEQMSPEEKAAAERRVQDGMAQVEAAKARQADVVEA
jgi:hypothetical protein